MMKDVNYRHELKFICKEVELDILEEKIKLICKPDPYANSENSYTIRSVYFDTYDDVFLKENEAGVDNYIKYRIRIYNFSDELIKLECKQTIYGMKVKESCALTKEQCMSLLHHNYRIRCMEGQELLARFLQESMLRIYLPKVIVDYQRSAYIHPIGNVRITLDRNISSSYDVVNFFEKGIGKRLVMPKDVHVLEVKYDEVLPDMFWNLISGKKSIQRTSFSKYYRCRKNSLC